MVWTILFSIFMDFKHLPDTQTLFWGLFSGVFSVTANILLIEGMIYNDAGKCSTVYRLNLIFVALGAFLLLGEAVTTARLLGIMFALIAIVLFFLDSPRTGHRGRLVKLGFYMIGTAALLRAGMALSYKYALTIGVDRSSLLALNGIMWVIGGGIYALVKEKHMETKFNSRNWNYGLVSSILICGTVLFMALALEKGDASVILPLAQMSFILTGVLGIIFFKEKLSTRKILGAIAGILCILCLSSEL
jgi:uncharacterized membrane protein